MFVCFLSDEQLLYSLLLGYPKTMNVFIILAYHRVKRTTLNWSVLVMPFVLYIQDFIKPHEPTHQRVLRLSLSSTSWRQSANLFIFSCKCDSKNRQLGCLSSFSLLISFPPSRVGSIYTCGAQLNPPLYIFLLKYAHSSYRIPHLYAIL